jgi:hypothetical protein
MNFCNKCGKPVPKPNQSPAELAMEAAKVEFEKNAAASIDRSKITYICELCGVVNGIDSPKCTRCGKPRPRDEFIEGLRKLRYAQQTLAALSEEVVIAPEQPEEVQPVYRLEPEQSKPAKPVENTVVSGNGGPIIQQLVIVPYVNPAQNLWQYNPNIAYRYVPDAALPVQQHELTSLAEEEETAYQEPTITEGKIKLKKQKRVGRLGATISLLLSALVLVSLLMLPIIKGDQYKGIELFKLVTSAKGIALITPAGSCALAAFAAINVIVSIFAIFSKNGVSKGIKVILGILILISAIAVVGGIPSYVEMAEIFSQIQYGGYAIAIASILIFALALISGGKKSKRSVMY